MKAKKPKLSNSDLEMVIKYHRIKASLEYISKLEAIDNMRKKALKDGR